ncbi:MAG TPA: tRNA (guanosine(37)-N1)-methyltransferase TrmD [Alphaproteobacteria bacterium]|nr:tRNA (guanosine(37)-N1)-methyltransferase TrmD [Alphaproteobacteria bacterium]
MHFNLISIFPELFPGALATGLTGKALEKGVWSFDTINIRDFAEDKHKTVDDTPYGGGAGMVMRPDVLAKAIDHLGIRNQELGISNSGAGKIIYMSPRGTLLNQRKVEELAGVKTLSIICARYEGVDQRVLDKYGVEEVSVGDFILTNGEIAAYLLIDACVRKINGVLGNPQTHDEESFSIAGSSNLLEYPHYTRPEVWSGFSVPDVLKSGNHALIAKWRLEKAKELTAQKRPDLWAKFLKS